MKIVYGLKQLLPYRPPYRSEQEMGLLQLPPTETANTTITLPSTTGTLALTSQLPASEYFIGKTTTAQSINNSITTELTLNGFTASGNVDLFTNGDIRVPSTGVYLIKVNPAFAANETGYRTVSLQLNATTLLSEISCPAVNGTETAMFTADVASLTAGDNLRVQVF